MISIYNSDHCRSFPGPYNQQHTLCSGVAVVLTLGELENTTHHQNGGRTEQDFHWAPLHTECFRSAILQPLGKESPCLLPAWVEGSLSRFLSVSRVLKVVSLLFLVLDKSVFNGVDSHGQSTLLIVISPFSFREVNLLKLGICSLALCLPSFTWLEPDQLQSSAFNLDDGNETTVIRGICHRFGDEASGAFGLAALALHDQVGLATSRRHFRRMNGVHGNVFGISLATLCALDLEVPSVVRITWNELLEVLELSPDLKCKNRHGEVRVSEGNEEEGEEIKMQKFVTLVLFL